MYEPLAGEPAVDQVVALSARRVIGCFFTEQWRIAEAKAAEAKAAAAAAT